MTDFLTRAREKGFVVPDTLFRSALDRIRNAARRGGMRTLAEDGWRLVAAGVTTVQEVLSVTTAKEIESATKIQTGESTASIAVAR